MLDFFPRIDEELNEDMQNLFYQRIIIKIIFLLYLAFFSKNGFSHFSDICYQISRQVLTPKSVMREKTQALINRAKELLAPYQNVFLNGQKMRRIYDVEARNDEGQLVTEKIGFGSTAIHSGRVLSLVDIELGPIANFKDEGSWKDLLKLTPPIKLHAGVKQAVAVKRKLCLEAKKAGFEVLILRGSRIEGVKKKNGQFGATVNHIVDLSKISSDDLEQPVEIEQGLD